MSAEIIQFPMPKRAEPQNDVLVESLAQLRFDMLTRNGPALFDPMPGISALANLFDGEPD